MSRITARENGNDLPAEDEDEDEDEYFEEEFEDKRKRKELSPGCDCPCALTPAPLLAISCPLTTRHLAAHESSSSSLSSRRCSTPVVPPTRISNAMLSSLVPPPMPSFEERCLRCCDGRKGKEELPRCCRCVGSSASMKLGSWFWCCRTVPLLGDGHSTELGLLLLLPPLLLLAALPPLLLVFGRRATVGMAVAANVDRIGLTGGESAVKGRVGLVGGESCSLIRRG